MIYLVIVLFFCLSFNKKNFDRFLTVSSSVLIFYALALSPRGLIGILIGVNFFTFIAVAIIIGFYKLNKKILFIKKTAFGSIKVTYDEKLNANHLIAGNIIHGVQPVDPDLKHLPFGQFHKNGPLGKIFDIFSNEIDTKPIAVIGLGPGTLAAYSKENQEVTFFEINPAIIEIAKNEKLFTYLKNSKGKINIIAGDASQKIKEVSSKYFIIIIDAYVEGKIPENFLSLEFINTAFEKIDENGFIIFQTTGLDAEGYKKFNNFILENKLKAFFIKDYETKDFLKDKSEWFIISKNYENIRKLEEYSEFERVLPKTLNL